MQLAPFAHAQVGQEVRAAPVAQLALGAFLVFVVVGQPQLHQRQEIALFVDEDLVRCVGEAAHFGRAFAWILDRQAGGDDQCLVEHPRVARGDQCARQAHVDRQPGHVAADLRQLLAVVDGADLAQQQETVLQCTVARRIEKRETGGIAKIQIEHAQDHAGQ